MSKTAMHCQAICTRVKGEKPTKDAGISGILFAPKTHSGQRTAIVTSRLRHFRQCSTGSIPILQTVLFLSRRENIRPS